MSGAPYEIYVPPPRRRSRRPYIYAGLCFAGFLVGVLWPYVVLPG